MTVVTAVHEVLSETFLFPIRHDEEDEIKRNELILNRESPKTNSMTKPTEETLKLLGFNQTSSKII